MAEQSERFFVQKDETSWSVRDRQCRITAGPLAGSYRVVERWLLENTARNAAKQHNATEPKAQPPTTQRD